MSGSPASTRRAYPTKVVWQYFTRVYIFLFTRSTRTVYIERRLVPRQSFTRVVSMTTNILRNAISTVAAAALALSASTSWADGIGASLLTQQHPFYIQLAEAMQQEATSEDVPLEISIANQDLSKQLADIEDFIVKGIDVLIISPVDSQGVLPAIMKAQQAGIDVITVDIPAEGV